MYSLITDLSKMVRQQTQRRGPRSRQASSVIRHGDGNEDAVTYFDEHRKALEYLAGALDLSMLESKHSAVVRSCESLVQIMRDSDKFLRLLKSTQILQLYTHAAVNSMDVVLQSFKGCLLDYSKAAGIVGSLCSSISHCMELVHDKGSKAREALHLQLTDSGLVPALSRFTVVTWQAVQQLGTVDNQQQSQQQQRQQQQSQRQQQRDLEARQGTASTLVAELLVLWHSILRHTLISPRPDMLFDTALPALIGLTAELHSLLEEVTASIGRSGYSSTLLAACNVAFESAALTRLDLAEYIVLLDQSKRQQVQDIYLTGQQPTEAAVNLALSLAKLLLQLLAYQVGQLHTACGGVSQSLQDRHTATADQSQLQDQQQPLVAGCSVPKSHLALLQVLELDCFSDSAGVKAQNIPDLVRQYTRTLHAVCSAILPRCAMEDQPVSSSSSSCSTHDAGQQQLESTYRNIALPSQVVVPIVKMLIEVVLLTPPGNNLALHTCSLNVSHLLLHVSTLRATAAAAAAAGGHQPGQEVPALHPWPQLPAAVAAGLLRPVVAQLPQAVIYCLLQTDQQQQQHQIKNDRLMLLHHYGSLLIAVCQSVESKHIAAVLKSQSAPDLLVTLAAIEAVIRAQACHLAPQLWKEEQQRQPEAELYETASSSTSTSSYLVPDILQYPQDQAPVLLLPFALKVTEALLELVQQPRQQQHWLAASDRADCNALLCVRLFTLMTTVLTLCQAAVVGAGSSGTATQATVDVRQRHMVGDVLSTASEVSYAAGSVAYHWWRAVDEGTPAEASKDLAVVLLFRAVAIWSCHLCQLLQTMPSQHINDAANPVHVASLLAGLVDSVIHVIDVLQPLATAVASPDQPAPLSAAAPESVAMAAEPIVSHRRHPGSSERVYLVYHCLAELLQRSRNLRTAVQSALQLGVNSMEADTSVSSAPQTQGWWPVGKLQHFADTLQHLCETVLAAFPPRYCCSNAPCTNLTKLSEWQLVGGKACVCAGCGLARYCSTSCQKQHWDLHKPVCSSHAMQCIDMNNYDACLSNCIATTVVVE